jgi:hypothetical protein
MTHKNWFKREFKQMAERNKEDNAVYDRGIQ